MPNVTSSTQLSTFSLIRNAIRSDSVLSARFKSSDFYEFEPKLKGSATLPLWVVKVPGTDTPTKTVDMKTHLKSFTVDIMLKMDWSAMDKVTDYCNRAVSAIEAYETTFNSSGYYNVSASVNSVEDEIEDQKQIIVALLSVTLSGAVSY